MTLQMKFDEKFEEGLEQGRQKENRQIIKNMLKKNFSVETISECTNQSLDYIRQIQEEQGTADACVVQEEIKYDK